MNFLQRNIRIIITVLVGSLFLFSNTAYYLNTLRIKGINEDLIRDEARQEYEENLEALIDEKDNIISNIISSYEEEIHNLEKMIQEIEDSYNSDIDNKHEVIDDLEREIASLREQIIEKHLQFTASQYPEATQVWKGLKEAGLSDIVVAGIIGNIMTEVGGHTFNIRYWSLTTNGDYYGMCQWKGPRRERLLKNYGKTIDAQIKFLLVELYEIFPEGSSFYTLQDEQEVALLFAKNFERCGSGSYKVRQQDATKALEYFSGV